MDLSVVIATRNKASYLERTLDSIVYQRPDFDYEVIVVDDGSTDHTKSVCERNYVNYIKLEKNEYSNPGWARNVGYKAAQGKIIVTQSDEVIHISPHNETLQNLFNLLNPQEALIATVYNAVWDGVAWCLREVYTSPQHGSGLFFLAALWREDVYAVGGNDEDFTEPGGEDCFFTWCIQHRSKLVWTDQVIGYHQDHPRPENTNRKEMDELAHYKRALAQEGKIPWTSSGGAWKYE
jgi:glycosyltransferase involved in cell wall biosynthesis